MFRLLTLGCLATALALTAGCTQDDSGGGNDNGNGNGNNGSGSAGGICDSVRGADLTYTRAVRLAESSEGCPNLDVRDLNDDDDDDDDVITTCNPNREDAGSVCILTASCVLTASDGSAATLAIAFNVRNNGTFTAHYAIRLQGGECVYALEGTWL